MSGASVGGSAVIRVSVSQIAREPDWWPRAKLDAERVEEFLRLLLDVGSGAFPLIEVICVGPDRYVVAEGHHRFEAISHTDLDVIDVVLLTEPPDRQAADVAYERGLATAAQAALPLTRAERHAAIHHLKATRAELSNHQIGELVGCSHQTVGRVLARSNGPATVEDDRVSGGDLEAAARLFNAIEKVYEARGLGLWDAISRDHTGERLARALRIAYDQDALDRAERYREWFDRAIETLDGRRS